LIASEASNPSLKRKSPKQTRTNSVFAKVETFGGEKEYFTNISCNSGTSQMKLGKYVHVMYLYTHITKKFTMSYVLHIKSTLKLMWHFQESSETA
jgi:hypothetical protein